MSEVMGNARNGVVAAGIYGLAVGDALGVPVEFQSRDELRDNSVTGMRAFGTHRQPAGAWSDDTSLALCLAESLCDAGIDYEDQGRRFVSWYKESAWTPHGVVFDIGNATREAIHRLASGVAPTAAGLSHENSNGNGSLMRILPLAIYLAYATSAERIEAAMNCSRVTHGHPRCQIACAYYVEVAAAIVRGDELNVAMADASNVIDSVVLSRYPAERRHSSRLLNADIDSLGESNIASSGYVIHCLEASVWCLVRNNSYADSVLAAVNLGDDSDATDAVTGGLAGLRFGFDSIPSAWRAALARFCDIAALVEKFQCACEHRWATDQSSHLVTSDGP